MYPDYGYDTAPSLYPGNNLPEVYTGVLEPQAAPQVASAMGGQFVSQFGEEPAVRGEAGTPVNMFDSTYESMTWYGMPASSPALNEFEQ